MKRVLLLLFVMAGCGYSDVAPPKGKLFCEFSLNTQKTYFLVIEDGINGKFSASIGLIPVAVFEIAESHKTPVLKVFRSGKMYTFRVVDSQRPEDVLGEFTREYDLKKRVDKVKKERKHAVKEPRVESDLSGVRSRSAVMAVVSGEIYKLSLYEASDVRKLQKLPVSTLFPSFAWQVLKFE